MLCTYGARARILKIHQNHQNTLPPESSVSRQEEEEGGEASGLDAGDHEPDHQLEAEAVINAIRYNVEAGARGCSVSDLVNPQKVAAEAV